jgi:hypothetical protein
VESGVKVGSTGKKKQIKVSVRTALAQESFMVALIDWKKSQSF